MYLVAAISNEVLWMFRADMCSIQVLFMDLVNHFLPGLWMWTKDNDH